MPLPDLPGGWGLPTRRQKARYWHPGPTAYTQLDAYQNLSPRLALLLQDLYPGSCHAQDLHLDRAPDEMLWGTAEREGLTIVTRDSDFADRSMLARSAPKVVWIRVGNCATREIEALLRDHLEDIGGLAESPEASVLIIR